MGAAALVFIAAMGGGWLFRALVLRALRERHPDEFAALGSPSSRQLASLLPRYREQQLQFWKSLWGGKFFGLGDAHLSRLAWAALACDVALLASMALVFWSAGSMGPGGPPGM